MTYAKLIPILATLLIIGAGCSSKTAIPEGDANSKEKNVEQTTPSVTIATEDASPEFTVEEVAAHATENDCWMIIRGGVYDATNTIARHPGGKAILDGCGKDATELFETRPMGSGTPHSDRAKTGLEEMKIGTLAK